MNKLLLFTLVLLSVFTFASCKDDDEENNATNETEIIDEGNQQSSIFIVTDVFKVTGKGVVVSGNVKSGNIKVGDVIYIYTETGNVIKATAKRLTLFNKLLDEISEGDSNAAILLDTLTVSETAMVPVGSVIATSKSSKVASAHTLMVDVNFKDPYTDLPSSTIQLYNGGSDYMVVVKGISLSTNGYAQRYTLEVYSSISDSYFAPIYNGCEITLRKDGKTYATGIATIVK